MYHSNKSTIADINLVSHQQQSSSIKAEPEVNKLASIPKTSVTLVPDL